jgi:hypothetical protein
MEILLIVIVVIGGLWFYAMKRGHKAVRAYAYLNMRMDGKSPGEANDFASRIDMNTASKMNQSMLMFVRLHFNGMQLEMISAARLDGFKE